MLLIRSGINFLWVCIPADPPRVDENSIITRYVILKENGKMMKDGNVHLQAEKENSILSQTQAKQKLQRNSNSPTLEPIAVHSRMNYNILQVAQVARLIIRLSLTLRDNKFDSTEIHANRVTIFASRLQICQLYSISNQNATLHKVSGYSALAESFHSLRESLEYRI